MMSRYPDVVLTGIGVVAPTGVGTTEHWRSVLKCESGIRPISRFDAADYPVQLAGEVAGFLASDRVPGKLRAETDISTQMGLAAAAEALEDADVGPSAAPEYELAVVTASSSGGTEFGQREMTRLYQKGPRWVSAYQSIAWFYAATSGQISIRHGLRGPSSVLCTEQAGGLDAIGHARRLLATGTQVVLAGGADASLCPYGLAAQLTVGKMCTELDPTRAYRPFSADACGYLPGEGGAMIVAETAQHAAERGVVPHARVAGYAAGFDPPPGSGRPRALRRTIEQALADAELGPADVDVIFTDAMGVAADDLDESSALREVFGANDMPPVAVPKTLTGRMYAGAALDVATAALALRDGVIPPAAGTTRVDPTHGLDVVLAQPRTIDLRTALLLARGHGGFTSALLLSHHPQPV